MKLEKSCGAVIYIKENDNIKYLLLQNLYGSQWGFAKGHMEEGESEEETAKREILEEAGIKVKFISGFRQEISYTIRGDIFKVAVFFLGETEDKNVTIQEGEIKDYCFATYEDAKKLIPFANLKRVLDKANNTLKEGIK